MSIRTLLYLFVAAVGLSSCKNSGDIAPVYKTASLNLVNADNNALNVYQNGTRIYNPSPLSPGGTSGYVAVKYGTQQYQLKIASPDKPDYLFTGYTLTLDTLKNYSLFIAGETPDKLFLVEDVKPAATTQAAIRFVNTLPGTVNLDVTIGSLSFTNSAFKSYSAFTFINAGINAIKIYQSGSATPLVSDVLTLTAGTTYTVFTTGTINGTGTNKLTAKLILN
ncbi:MAG: DUF4397 domain-containing protein [Mucilaginibacter sp.]